MSIVKFSATFCISAPFLATVILADPAFPPESIICTVSPASRAALAGNVIVILPAVHITLSLTLA